MKDGVHMSFNYAGREVHSTEDIQDIIEDIARIQQISIEDIEDTIRRVMSNEHESPSIQSIIHSVYEQKEWESKDIKPIKSYRDLEYKHKRRVR